MAPAIFRNFIRVALLSVILTAGCKCDRKKLVKQPSVTQGITVTALPLATGVNETLPILYVDAQTIDNLQGKIIFRFFVDSENDLSIHGWRDNFDKNPPVLIPRATRLSNVKIAANTYMGNLYLDAQALNALQRQLGTGPGESAYLKFVPIIDNREGSVGQITYQLIPTNTLPVYRTTMRGNDSLLHMYDTTAAQPAVVDPTILNPSPPRKETL